MRIGWEVPLLRSKSIEARLVSQVLLQVAIEQRQLEQQHEASGIRFKTNPNRKVASSSSRPSVQVKGCV